METQLLKELGFKKFNDDLWIYIGDLYIITCSNKRHKDISDMAAIFRESEKRFIASSMIGDKEAYKSGFSYLVNMANEHIGEIIKKQISEI